MTIDPHADRSIAATPRRSRHIPLADVDNAVLLEGLALWRRLQGENRYPARAQVTPRLLKPLLRNTCLIKVIDGGGDYEYRIVGDAYVQAHGLPLQGKLLSQAKALAPGYCACLKTACDEVVREGRPIATRGWLERAATRGNIYAEYLFLPLGADEVDHILVFAAYARRDGVPRVAGSVSGSFDT